VTARLVLGIAGSPRRRGNSDVMLDAALAGAEAAGARVERVVASDAGIAPCRGCNACSRDGRCIQTDGMAAVYELLDAADVIVVATPVFFASVPSTLKALYDRCQPYWARRYVLGEPPPEHKRPGALLIAAGGGDPYGHGCAEAPTRSVFAVLGVELTDEIVAEPVDAARDVLAKPEVIEACRALGERLGRPGAGA
jgi:multimeric flavodoxin WrbA